MAPSHLSAASKTAGKVAENAENLKFTNYSSLAHDYDVTPICVEILGPCGPSGLSFVLEIGRRMMLQTGEPRSASFLMQSISMAVQRGNASSVMGTVLKGKDLEEIYYL